MLRNFSEKLRAKFSLTMYTWLLYGKNCFPWWCFLRNYQTGSKPSRRSITAAKRYFRSWLYFHLFLCNCLVLSLFVFCGKRNKYRKNKKNKKKRRAWKGEKNQTRKILDLITVLYNLPVSVLALQSQCSAYSKVVLADSLITVDITSLEEAAWSSGLGRWCCNPEIPGSRLPACH